MRTTHSTGKSYAKGEPFRGHEPSVEEEGLCRVESLEEFLEFFDVTEKEYNESSEKEQEKHWTIFENYLISQKREDDAVAAFEAQQEY